MNLNEMRDILRADLRDEDSGNYRWSDDELDRHIQHALKDFSEALPYEQKATLATTAGSRDLDISGLTGKIVVEAVEYPVGSFPRRYQRFFLWGDTLTLLGDETPDGSDAAIYYGKLHTLDAGTSTIPARHEDLVAAGAAGYASVAWAVYGVNRVNTGGLQTPRDFLEWGNLKLKYFRQELRRLGRKNRVRTGSLYAPAGPIVNGTTDYGP